MSGLSLLVLACALAVDAFAVAIVTGLTLKPLTVRQVLRMVSCFGLFQALMPVVGWAAGNAVHAYIAAFDHWVAFGLLVLIGGKMAWSAIRGEDRNRGHSWSDPTSGRALVVLSVATSIDALAVGISLAMVGGAILVAAMVIGIAAAWFTATGMLLGRRIGRHWGRRVEVVGGLVLIGIGVKIVTEHVLA